VSPDTPRQVARRGCRPPPPVTPFCAESCGWGPMPRRKFAWSSLPDEELLRLRFKDLKVTVDGTWLEDCLARLHEELAEQSLRVRPHAWISNEWFSPDDAPGI